MKTTICLVSLWTIFATAFFCCPALAGEVTLPNTFTSGTPAVAAEVNANFAAVESAVDDNHSRVAALESALAALRETVADQAAMITALQESQVMALDPYLTVDTISDTRGPLVRLSGINLQVVNGEGSTATVNGLGNVIIGYDEENTWEDRYRCSDGAYIGVSACEGAGAVWSHSHKSGSHYLVLGSENNYSQYGGLAAGYQNYATRGYSTVTGGRWNAATGLYSSVSGGGYGTSRGDYSSVSSGYLNTARGDYSSASGGRNNEAGGSYSSVSGGESNEAGGPYSSVSGGSSNTVSGNTASISGGSNNTSSGDVSSVSGGRNNDTSGRYSSVSGGSSNSASGSASSVGGGAGNTASGEQSSVSGGYEREAGDLRDWAAGPLWEDE